VFLLLACHRPLSDVGESAETASVETGETDSPAEDSTPVDTAPEESPPEAEPCPPPEEPLEAGYLPMGTALAVAGESCAAARIRSSGPVDAVVELTLEGWEGADPPKLTVTDAGGHPLLAERPWGGPIEVQLWQSGEIKLTVSPATEGAWAGTVGVQCVGGCDRAWTRYPVVLLHGMGGAETVGGVDYFYELREVLDAEGYLVRNPSVEPFATSVERASQWSDVLDELTAAGVGEKFNLVAHSQGGLDARYLISGLGQGARIASLTTVGAPHAGTPVADVLGGTIDDGIVSAEIVDLCTAVFASLYGLEADDPSLTETLAFLTTENMAAFNAAYPDDPEVYYASWAGWSCALTDGACQDAHGGETIEPLLDPLYLLLAAYGWDSDGLVPVESAAWGDYRGTIDADHVDEIGHFSDESNPAFDHRAFYLAELAHLAELGW
jgi:triacylglycerol lipase